MKKLILIFGLVLATFLILSNFSKKTTESIHGSPTAKPTPSKSSNPTPKIIPKYIWGSYYSPRNFPTSIINQSKPEMEEYFNTNKQFGSQVALQVHLNDNSNLSETYASEAKKRGFGIQLYLDPLTDDRSKPAPPDTLTGKGFDDPSVKSTFKQRALELAALKPDILSLATEVNILADKNQKEFDNLSLLIKESYNEIKSKYPRQNVSVNFQLEKLKKQNEQNILDKFSNSIDIFGFTSYPNASGSIKLPADYFSSIRKYLPKQRIAISEIAWYSGIDSEQRQADFYANLPTLLKDVTPEYINQFWLFDMPNNMPAPFDAIPQKFRTGGLLRSDGSPKPAFEILKNAKP